MRNSVIRLIVALGILVCSQNYAQAVCKAGTKGGCLTPRDSVTRLGIRFKQGCVPSNTEGSCTIETVGFGKDFESAPAIQVYSSASRQARFYRISSFKRHLDQDGRARARFKNIPHACYQVRMSKSADQKAVFSNILWEDDGNTKRTRHTGKKKHTSRNA